MKKLIDKLHQEQILSAEEFRTLLTDRSEETDLYARELADQVRQQVYGNQIYVRGLIEFTNYCKNDCYYCGIRRSNRETVFPKFRKSTRHRSGRKISLPAAKKAMNWDSVLLSFREEKTDIIQMRS